MKDFSLSGVALAVRSHVHFQNWGPPGARAAVPLVKASLKQRDNYETRVIDWLKVDVRK